MKYRIEKDSLGEMQVPENAYYGAQTQRAVENFKISNLRFSEQFIKSLALIKKSAAIVNNKLGLIENDVSKVIIDVSDDIISGKYMNEFVIDIFQTGSGTSTNMNINEVIANIAAEKMGGENVIVIEQGVDPDVMQKLPKDNSLMKKLDINSNDKHPAW